MESLNDANKNDDKTMNRAIKDEQLQIEAEIKVIEYMHLRISHSSGISM